MPLAVGAIGAAGAGAGAAVGAGMLKGSGYAMEAMDGYDYSAKGMYSSSMYGMGGRYEESGALLTAGEMATGGAGAGMRAIGVLGSGSGAGAQVSFGAAGAGGSQVVLNEEFMRGYFFDVSICDFYTVVVCFHSARLRTLQFYNCICSDSTRNFF